MDGFVLEARSIAFGKLDSYKRAQNEESDDTDIDVEAFSFWVTHNVYFSKLSVVMLENGDLFDIYDLLWLLLTYYKYIKMLIK